jgi:hypothetical protein
MRLVRLVLAVLPVLGLSLLAQGAAVPPATYMSAADISKGLSTAVAADAAAGAAVTISPGIVVRRRSGGGEPQYAVVHPFSTEVYYIVEGTGSLVTGGTLEMPLALGGSRHRGGIKDSVEKGRRGDVIVIPPAPALVQRDRRNDPYPRGCAGEVKSCASTQTSGRFTASRTIFRESPLITVWRPGCIRHQFCGAHRHRQQT